LIFLSLGLWSVMVVWGFGTLLRYSTEPGSNAEAPANWPSGTIPFPKRRALLAFLHPQCPCSRATVNELARIMVRANGEVTAMVFFFAPSSEPGNWSKTDLWQQAKSIPGVQVLDDIDGVAASRFGATTSGQVLFYEQDSRRVFSGGITPYRGHSGDNDGR